MIIEVYVKSFFLYIYVFSWCTCTMQMFTQKIWSVQIDCGSRQRPLIANWKKEVNAGYDYYNRKS